MGAGAKLEQLTAEAWPLAQMWYFAQRAKVLPQDENWAFCYDVLNRVSRSFAIVIQQLPAELRDSVCVFYLVLRALDTVEDDMAIPVSTKVPILLSFHSKLSSREWRMQCGTKEYARLMANYPKVTEAFLRLPSAHQKVIEEITSRMGRGMAEFIERDVVTVQDYDLYCHYVAGLVGIGLSKLYCGLESPEFVSMETLSNDMGLFLQKTNIIRDYLEDIMEEPAPRMFWPKEIWGKYGPDLADFKSEANSREAVQALNHMIADALRHAPECLKYMSKLRNRDIFRFCAIPQVMAIATLAEVYNNPRVFTGVVKVRRGTVARYMVGLNSYADVLRAFLHFAGILAARCEAEAAGDPNQRAILERVHRIASDARHALGELGQPPVASPNWAALVLRLSVLVAVAMALAKFVGPSSLASRLLQLLLISPPLAVAVLFVYSSVQRV